MEKTAWVKVMLALTISGLLVVSVDSIIGLLQFLNLIDIDLQAFILINIGFGLTSSGFLMGAEY